MSIGDESARRAREDADFQRIVEGYGERPLFPELVEPVAAVPEEDPASDTPAELAASGWLDDDRFVPAPPPPAPRPHGVRGLAWVGLFGVPIFVLVTIMVGMPLPSPLPLLLLVWFVGGFGYLVATMAAGPGPDSGWDDGAVL